ncbi:MAG: ABC transporter permease [Bryobacteraceae bacterium]
MFGWLKRKSSREREIEDELDYHLAMVARERMEDGDNRSDAAFSARRKLGNKTLITEITREMWTWGWLERIAQDLRYAWRMMLRSPGFAAIAVITLALGIGANTAIFSLVDAFLLRPLPVKHREQLVLVQRVLPKGGGDDFAYPDFEKFRDHNHSLSGIFAWDGSTVVVNILGQPEVATGDFVSGSYFDVLGVKAILGRTFTAQDDRPGKTPVAVISYKYWNRRFGKDPSVVGKTISLAGTPFTIIGVTSPHFFGTHVAGRSADVVLPMFVRRWLALKDHDTFEVMARLKPGITIEQARADLDVIYHHALLEAAGSRLSAQTKLDIRAQRIELKPGLRGTSDTNDRFALELRILLAIVAITLLIASVNVANLLLARAAARQREIAVRLAIGASRRRVIRQLLTESILLATVGGAVGLLFAKWGVGLILAVLAYGQSEIPFDLSPDLKILAFTGAVSILTGILFGFAPALTAMQIDLNPVLKGTERSTDAGPLRRRLAKSFIVSQVALSLVLLIGAGLLLRTLQQIYAVDTGFERDKVLIAWIFPAPAGYDRAREMTLYRELHEKLNEIPGVESASLMRYRLVTSLPYRNVRLEDAPGVSNDVHRVFCGPVAPQFFKTMGIHLLMGRDFSPADTENAPKVAVISESMARAYFPNKNAIGKHLAVEETQANVDMQIVGVVKDIRRHPWEQGSTAAVYIPLAQAPADDLGQMNLVVRTRAKPTSILASVRNCVQSLAKDLPLINAQTQEQEIDDNLGGQRSLATLLSFFGALALLLASIGLYGTMSYTVERRTKEIGIRMALGAEKKDMLWMVLGETITLVAIGVAIGVPVAVAATRFIASMLFNVKTADPITIVVAILGMLAISLLAGYIPARRATRVDPMVALRYE